MTDNYSDEGRRQIVTAQRLREVFRYDPNTGLFTWLVRPAPNVRIGNVAGSLRNDGYINIKIDDRSYLAHRLAWLYINNEWILRLDHKDGIKHHNWIDNLRPTTQSQNIANGRRHFDNTSGFKGVSWDESSRKWRALIKVNYRQIHLGCFGTPEEAHAAYCEAARGHFGEFARVT